MGQAIKSDQNIDVLDALYKRGVQLLIAQHRNDVHPRVLAHSYLGAGPKLTLTESQALAS